MPAAPLKVRIGVVALIRRGFRYLMVRDDPRGGTWYPPAGLLRHGEDLLSGTTRIVQEASGCTPELSGLVSIGHMPKMPGRDVSHWRYIFEGKLGIEALSETTALAPASYLLPAEIRALELRDESIADLIDDHARGRKAVGLDLYRIGLL